MRDAAGLDTATLNVRFWVMRPIAALAVAAMLVGSSAAALSPNPCLRAAELEELVLQALAASQQKIAELDACEAEHGDGAEKCATIKTEAEEILAEARGLNELRKEADRLCAAWRKRQK